MSSKTIEIEFRSIFDKEKYDKVESFLKEKAEDLGADDKDVYFFIMPDKLSKVVDNISKGNAKIVTKLNKIGKGDSFEEIEIAINREEVEKAVIMFKSLNLTENIMHSFQQRHNYQYKGVELALKYSDVWSYHLEMEIVVNDPKKEEAAKKKLYAVAEELDVHIMTDEELTEFTQKAEEKYRNKNAQNTA
ncbi:MAG: hypothetical protein ACQEP6_03140 [Patescibacteria group bacterium]